MNEGLLSIMTNFGSETDMLENDKNVNKNLSQMLGCGRIFFF